MDLHEVQNTLARLLGDVNAQFHKMPGSAIILRYIKSSYQNDPVRSAFELFLFLFAVRYMLSPSYSTQKKVNLTEEVCLRVWTKAGRRSANLVIGD
jgi:serine palmitoyltransferase